MSGPFTGIRVLDLSQYLAGPFAASKLGDLGADVIKVERPKTGDAGRVAAAGGLRLGGESPTFLALNRSKRSVALDLKTTDGARLLRSLAKTVDVLISNFRPGVLERLGIGYDALAVDNPRLVCVQASGYGATGPLSALPGQDLLVQAMSGLAASTGRASDPPIPTGAPIADVTMANQITLAVASALYARERTGLGQLVEVNLLDGLLDLQCTFMVVVLNSERTAIRSATGISEPYLSAPYGVYETEDGYLALAHSSLPLLGELVGEPELSQFPGLPITFDERDRIRDILARAIRGQTTAQWLAALQPHDVWCAPVLTHSDIMQHEQVRANDMIVGMHHPTAGDIRLTGIPLKFSKTAGAVSRPAPLLGEHTAEVLAELGCDQGELDRLEAAGVIECQRKALPDGG